MTWYFFEKQNRELRTFPPGLGSARISSIIWQDDWVGKTIQAGTVLALVSFAGGVDPQAFLVAPPGCDGTVTQTFDINLSVQTSISQTLLTLVHP